jgi:hypothetical protein
VTRPTHGPRPGMRERLLRLRMIKRSLEGHTEPPPPPTSRFYAGVIAIALSYAVAWPAMTLLGAIALYFHRPLWAAVGLPALYGLSWLIWAAGLWLAGPQSVIYARRFLRRLVKRFLLR